MRKQLSTSLLLSALTAATLTGCPTVDPITGRVSIAGIGCNVTVVPNIGQTQMTVGQKSQVALQVVNPCNHTLQYRIAADRGQILTTNILSPVVEYAAPFTGGPDTLRIAIYNQTDRVNLPQQQIPMLVMGEGMAFVEAPPIGTELSDTDNGVIKVAGIQGAGGIGAQPLQIAVGRQPKISPDGRYIAYTYYPGDGSSQVRIQDPAGNVTPLSGAGISFNRDPSWAPIGTDRALNLVFSSDRLSTSTGQGFAERGDAYNIWSVGVLGQNLRQLSSTPGSDLEPVWSPDGQFIVYRSNFHQHEVNNYWNLWRMELQTGRLIQLTYENAPDMGTFSPSFSPQGDRIVYTRKYKSRQSQAVSDFQKIWLVNLNQLDLPSLVSFLPGQLPNSGQGPVPVNPPNNSTTLPGTVGSLDGNFGNIATQEFDEGTIESFPSFSASGQWITYVKQQGDDVRVVSIPGNPGNLGTQGFEPLSVLPNGTRAMEVNWARQRPNGF